ncbi:MAG: ankyrin repeat domain-containing protein [Desulfatibacillum sp.]|nr:ankyrin repeat domain-containing protein [Desulfatibacillum sp.]
MKILKYLAVVIPLIALSPLSAWADTIVFKSGKEIEVKKVWEEEETFNCYRYGKLVKYPKITIDHINKGEKTTIIFQDHAPTLSNVPKWKCLVTEPVKIPDTLRVRTNYTKPGTLRTYKNRAYVLIKTGNMEEFEELVAKDPSIIFQADSEGNNFLMASARLPAIVQYFLQKGFDVNAGNDLGETALYWAMRWDEPESIRLLVSNGANMELLNDPGRSVYSADKEGTPFMIAVKEKKFNAAATLLKLGANINAYNSHGDTALHIACRTLKDYDLGKVKFLLNHGASIFAQNKWGLTPIESAIDVGLRDRITKQLEEVDMEMPSIPVMWGDVRTSMWMLASSKDVRPQTSIHYTATADIKAKHGKENPTATFALLRQNMELTKYRDRFGRTLLHWSGEYTNLDALEILLPYIIPVNVQDTEGNTALHLWAADNSAVKMLLAAGADPTIKNLVGQTPLHNLAHRWHYSSDIVELAKMYIKAGADPHAKDINGDTPIQLSKSRKLKEFLDSQR